MNVLAPIYSVTDLVCGKNSGRFTSDQIIPSSFEDMRSGLGLLGSAAVFLPSPLGPAVNNVLRATSAGFLWVGAGAALGYLFGGASWEAALVRGLDLSLWPAVRLYGQLPSLVGFAIKGIPLAAAAICGVAVGTHRGLTCPLAKFSPEDRSPAIKNIPTLGDKAVADDSDTESFQLAGSTT